MTVITIKDLLEAGVHFGHQTKRWNPKMKRFIFEERNGIYIIDLQKTMSQLKKACDFVRETVSQGGEVLFVGTKKQAKEAIYNAAARCGMHYVNERWLGGTLTNNATIRKSINRLIDLENMVAEGTMDLLPKKEVASLMREKTKLHRNLDGIKNMKRLPSVVFVVDTKRENIATAEAAKLKIPIIGIVDTNTDPDPIDYVIPANDDAIKSVSLTCSIIADVVIKVTEEHKQTRELEAAEKAEETKRTLPAKKGGRTRPSDRRPKPAPKKRVVVVKKKEAKPAEETKPDSASKKSKDTSPKQASAKPEKVKGESTNPEENEEKKD